ncbi:hypothetical protein KY331_05110 [Candidatus Woesearchaeota archaeon]|nr:hypothetical protein [Candidatus Woesearchaeota archaeon]
MQSILIVISSAVFMDFAISMGEDINAFLAPMENISAEAESDEEILASLGPMMEKYSHYKSILKNVTLFVVTMFALYIVINGINWNLSNFILNQKSLFLKYQLKFGILFLIFIIPLIAIINFASKYIFSIDQIQIAIPVYLIISLIFLYFMYISFAYIHKIKELKQIPKIIKQSLFTGIKKAKILISALILTTGLPVLALYTISTQLEANFLLLLFLIAVFILLINWGRITLLLVIKNLEKS